jgi:hypothetical protein
VVRDYKSIRSSYICQESFHCIRIWP